MKNLNHTNITQADIQNYILYQFDILSLTLAKFDFAGLLNAIELLRQEFQKQSEIRQQIPCTVINMPVEMPTVYVD